MIFARALCVLNRHRPDRDRVRWTGFNYVSNCNICGTRIRRLSHGNWRALKGAESDGEGVNI